MRHLHLNVSRILELHFSKCSSLVSSSFDMQREAIAHPARVLQSHQLFGYLKKAIIINFKIVSHQNIKVTFLKFSRCFSRDWRMNES